MLYKHYAMSIWKLFKTALGVKINCCICVQVYFVNVHACFCLSLFPTTGQMNFTQFNHRVGNHPLKPYIKVGAYGSYTYLSTYMEVAHSVQRKL